MRNRSNGKWKDPVRLPIIEDRQGHVRRRLSERDHVLFRHSPTAVRRNEKDHPKHHVSPRTTLTGSHRRIHGRQTSPTDRVGTKSRTIALNTTYLVIMKNVRDVSQVATLWRQLFPGRSKILTSAFADATSLPFGYLVVEMSPHSEDTYRLRTRVFPGEDPIVYVPKHL